MDIVFDFIALEKSVVSFNCFFFTNAKEVDIYIINEME